VILVLDNINPGLIPENPSYALKSWFSFFEPFMAKLVSKSPKSSCARQKIWAPEGFFNSPV
jgi:hypothetical protein